VLAERRRLSRPPWIEETRESWLEPEPHQWRLVAGTEEPLAMAVGLWIEGVPSLGGLSVRARMALHSLTGGQFAPIVVSVMPVVTWEHMKPIARLKVENDLIGFLNGHPELVQQIEALSARH